MTSKILVPIDFSPTSTSVVTWATSLARDREATLILLHVQEPIAENLGGEPYFPMPLEPNPGVRRALLETKPDDPAIPYEHRLLFGPAPDQIVKFAEDEHVDLIVMGSHGRGWLGRLLMGSVAECVMRHANCPVLIVKEKGSQPAHATQNFTTATHTAGRA